MHLSFTPDAPAMPEISFDDFLAVDIRIGTVTDAAPLEGARKPSIKMVIDFGEMIAKGPPDAILHDPHVAAVYLGPDEEELEAAHG